VDGICMDSDCPSREENPPMTQIQNEHAVRDGLLSCVWCYVSSTREGTPCGVHVETSHKRSPNSFCEKCSGECLYDDNGVLISNSFPWRSDDKPHNFSERQKASSCLGFKWNEENYSGLVRAGIESILIDGIKNGTPIGEIVNEIMTHEETMRNFYCPECRSFSRGYCDECRRPGCSLCCHHS